MWESIVIVKKIDPDILTHLFWCDRQSGTKAGFLWVLRFPLSIIIPPTTPYSLIILLSALYNLDTDSVVK
jgi:hypothetical protein